MQALRAQDRRIRRLETTLRNFVNGAGNDAGSQEQTRTSTSVASPASTMAAASYSPAASSSPGASNFLTEYLKRIPGGEIGDFDFGAFPKGGFKNGDKIPHSLLSPPVDANGKIMIPAGLTRIKIDIGLSWNSPNSGEWLDAFPNMAVIGVEPSIWNIMSVIRINYFKRKWDGPFSGRRFWVIPMAVDSSEPRMATFYQGSGDGGTSSLNEFQRAGSVRFERRVPTMQLRDLIAAIPEDRFPYIEHVKSDTQGNDVKVLQSAGELLAKRVVYYSAEPGEFEKNQYKTSHNGEQLKQFMAEAGFEMIKQQANDQWTFLNKKFKNHPDLSKMDYSCG